MNEYDWDDWDGSWPLESEKILPQSEEKLLACVEVLDRMVTMERLSQALRKAVRDCGESRYRISQETGINQSTLSRFMGGAALSTDNADRLAEYLGLELVKRTKEQESG